VLARVTVQGDPADAELVIDGGCAGHTPQSLDLPAIEHRIEVRKDGFLAFTGSVDARHRTRAHRVGITSRRRIARWRFWKPRQRLRATPPGMRCAWCRAAHFRWEAIAASKAARPNEGLRHVTLKRPFYLGVMEVTNGGVPQVPPRACIGLHRPAFHRSRQPTVTGDVG